MRHSSSLHSRSRRWMVRKIEWISKKSSSAIRFHFSLIPPPPPPSTPHLSYPAPLNLSFWHHYALRAQSEEAAHKKINKGNSESFAPFMPFRFQFLLFLRLLCATLFLLVLSPISVRFRVVFVSHFHNMQSFNGELENFPTANQIDAVLPIVVTTVVYFRCCRHECRKDRYIYIYSFARHSACAVWWNIQHAFIDWKLAVFTIHRNLYRRRYVALHNIFKSVVRIGEAEPASHRRTVMYGDVIVLDSVPLQFWWALLSNWKWDETHTRMKYIARYFPMTEIKPGSLSLSLPIRQSKWRNYWFSLANTSVHVHRAPLYRCHSLFQYKTKKIDPNSYPELLCRHCSCQTKWKMRINHV